MQTLTLDEVLCFCEPQLGINISNEHLTFDQGKSESTSFSE